MKHLPFEQQLADYLTATMEAEDPVLSDLYRQTHLKALNPRMAAGHWQGTLLNFLVALSQSQNILEIGTYTGYSTICMARALPDSGHLYTIEMNDELNDFSTHYFEKAGVKDQITLINGDALEVIPQLASPFDFVFIDGNKAEYPAYYKNIIDKVKPGGLLIADNTLWGNKVLDETAKDKETTGVIQFNKIVAQDTRVQNIMIPYRDGLTLLRKRN